MPRLLERAFLEPFRLLVEQLIQVIPPIVAVGTILIFGSIAAYLVRRVVYRLLVLARFDRLADQAGFAGAIVRTGVFASPSDCGARLAQGLLWLFIVLLALSAASTQVTQGLIQRFVNYIPDMLTAVLVLLLGSVVSKFLARSALLAAVNAQWSEARLLAGAVRVLVMLLAVVVALEQLRIGRTALLVSFAILFGGIVVAAAIAFGLGARDLARDWLREKLRPRESSDDEAFRHL